MLNNKLGKVALANTKRPRARFNLAHDVNTTADWGSLQPLQCKLMIPNSKATCDVESLVRLAPMVAPTFGRCKLKTWHHFVALSDLSQNFTHLLAQEPVSRQGNNGAGSVFTPLNVPNMSLALLSTYIMYGAKLTIYKVSSSSNGDEDVVTDLLYKMSTDTHSDTPPADNTLSNDIQAVITDFGTTLRTSSSTTLGISNKLGISRSALIGSAQSSASLGHIFISNEAKCDCFSVDSSTDYYKLNASYRDMEDVTLEGADYVIPFTTTSGATYHLAFRLSSFGKRLRKILIGCGYQINFHDNTKVSLFPLFAFYKAYFEVFGLTLFDAWETTNAYKCLYYFDQDVTNVSVDAIIAANSSNDFTKFMFDLGDCFYTDEQDYVSAHAIRTGVSPSPSAGLSFVDVDSNGINIDATDVDNTSTASVNGHVKIDDVIHGNLDSEYLKILYRWVNRNTIAGRRITELLRSQGLGAFVDSEKSNFIGYNETAITISDVVSSADTFQSASNQGALLGEYGGKGLQYDKSKTFSFETNEYGYWITLVAIVPQAGYCEALDQTVRAISKFQFYNPDFDGLGMEFEPKSVVQGSQPFADFVASSGTLHDSFGLIPRYSSFKVANNIMNGDFNLRSTRSNYLPYTLDKIIDVGERDIFDLGATGSGTKQYRVTKSFKADSLATAGNVWRYPTKYPFLGRFNRIFANVGSNAQLYSRIIDLATSYNYYMMFSNDYDNFLIHNIVNMQYYAPMLPISESFETLQEGNNGTSNGAISKA